MIENYNTYFRYTDSNFRYESELAIFFNGYSNPFVTKELWYLQLNRITNKTGFFYDKDNFLHRIYWDARKLGLDSSEHFLNNTNNLIKEAQPSKRYMMYIQVIKDKQNPEAEGQFFMFKCGRKIFQIISEHLQNSKTNNILKLKIKLTHGFMNFDESYMTDNEYIEPNIILPDLASSLSFKTFDYQQIQRKEKLKKIQKTIF